MAAFLRWSWLGVLAVGLATLQPHAGAAEWTFEVRFAETTRAEPFSGRVYLFFSNVGSGRPARDPRFGPNWFQPEPFVAQDVENWKPGETLTFSTKSPETILSYPGKPGELDVQGRTVQAVARFNPWERNVGTGPGNGFSEATAVAESVGREPQRLTISQLVPERTFEETAWSKLIRVKSKRLSEFHGRDVFVQGAVLLPASYAREPERRYPAIFTIPGFGGTHYEARRTSPIPEENAQGVEFLRVVLDPSCPLGHHVFADSANNGPWGTALIEEFLPEFDRRFRSIAKPTARLVTGHSSGGWSSLWLQVTWPEHFGGVWSTAPDPVEFHDFQKIDLYRPGENMYVDGAGKERPLARRNGQPVLWYRKFDHMETVLGPGGQLHSFEAVFSPRAADGRPVQVWNRTDGTIDTKAAKTWERYDIRLILERNWAALGPKLAGKIHVFMGDEDTFYLEGATIRLKETLSKLDSDAVIEIHPGKDHSNLITPELIARIRREMTAAVLKHHPEAAKPAEAGAR